MCFFGFETARRLPLAASDNDVLVVVEDWIDLIAEDRFEDAFCLSAHHPEQGWTPQLMQEVIAGYGLPDPHPDGPFSVTPRHQATGTPFNKDVSRIWEPVGQDGHVAVIWHDLPLNGVWSDLTVAFLLLRRPEAEYLILEEIHVF